MMTTSPDARGDIRPVPLSVSARQLLLITAGGLAGGALIVLGAVMPAEYNVDPLGLGQLTGISRLWAPDTQAFGGTAPLSYASASPKTAHVAEIPLGAAGWDEAAVEYKVRMSPGQSIFYRWSVVNLDGSPAATAIEVDQHGHDTPPEGQAETVIEFRKDQLLSDQGSLTAPFEGIFGWYFKNRAEDPVIVRLEVEGFYSLVAPGEPGNEFNVTPVEPAAPAPEDGSP
jgi:hypothetical protein